MGSSSEEGKLSCTLDFRVPGLDPCTVHRIQLIWGLAHPMPVRGIAGLIQTASLHPERERGDPLSHVPDRVQMMTRAPNKLQVCEKDPIPVI